MTENQVDDKGSNPGNRELGRLMGGGGVRGYYEEKVIKLENEGHLKLLGGNGGGGGGGGRAATGNQNEYENSLWSYSFVDDKMKNPSPTRERFEVSNFAKNEERIKKDLRKQLALEMEKRRQKEIYRNRVEKSAKEKAEEWYQDFLRDNFNEGPKAVRKPLSKKSRRKPTKRVFQEMELELGKDNNIDKTTGEKIVKTPENSPPIIFTVNSNKNDSNHQEKPPNIKEKVPSQAIPNENKNENENESESHSKAELLCLVKPKRMTFSETTIGVSIAKYEAEQKFSHKPSNQNNDKVLKSRSRDLEQNEHRKKDNKGDWDGKDSNNFQNCQDGVCDDDQEENYESFDEILEDNDDSSKSDGVLSLLKNKSCSGSSILEDSSTDSDSDSDNDNDDCREPDELIQKQNQQREKEEAIEALKSAVLAKQRKISDSANSDMIAIDKDTATDSESYYLSKSFSSYSIDKDWHLKDKINTAVKKSPKTPTLPPPPKSNPKRQMKNNRLSLVKYSKNLHYTDPMDNENKNFNSYEDKKKRVTFNENSTSYQTPLPKVGRISSKTYLTNPQLNLLAQSIAGSGTSEALSRGEMKKSSPLHRNKGKIVVKDMHRKDDISYIDDSYDTFYYKHHKPEMRRSIIVCKYRGLIRNRKAKLSQANQSENENTNETTTIALEQNPQDQFEEPPASPAFPASPPSTLDLDKPKDIPSKDKVKIIKTHKSIKRSSSVLSESKQLIPNDVSFLNSETSRDGRRSVGNLRQTNDGLDSNEKEKKARLKNILEEVKQNGNALYNNQYGVNYSIFKPIDYSQCELSTLLPSNFVEAKLSKSKSNNSFSNTTVPFKSLTSLDSNTKITSKKLKIRKRPNDTKVKKKSKRAKNKSPKKKSNLSSSKTKSKNKKSSSSNSNSKKSKSNTKIVSKTKKKSSKHKTKGIKK